VIELILRLLKYSLMLLGSIILCVSLVFIYKAYLVDTSYLEFEKSKAKLSSDQNPKIKWVNIDSIPKHVIDAIVVAEDPDFWNREPFLVCLTSKNCLGKVSIYYQLVRQLSAGEGVSSIYNQVARLFGTFHLERAVTKKQALELYLNAFQCTSGEHAWQQVSAELP
jgi:membrane peptidoglycan carboxypeptidase